MTIGLRAHDYGKKTAKELFSAIAGDGWQTMQLAIPKAITGADSFDAVTEQIVDEIKAELDASRLTVAVLGVYVDPALTDEAQRKKQAGYLQNALIQAKMLKAGCVGTETSVRGDGADIKALYRSLEELLPEAEKLGVNIGIEPVHRHTLCTPELTQQMIADFPSKSLKIIFDPINLLTPENINAQEDMYKRCMDCFGEKIAAIHMKGAVGELDGNGMLRDVPFSESVIDYRVLASCLREAANVPVLREGVEPSNAAGDLRFLREMFS